MMLFTEAINHYSTSSARDWSAHFLSFYLDGFASLFLVLLVWLLQ
jgi:hypothetical protein